MNVTLMTFFGLKSILLAYIAKNYTLVNKKRKERRIK